MPYKHSVNLHHRSARAHRLKRITLVVVGVSFFISLAVGVDWLIARVNSREPVISESTVTAVQSSQQSVLRTGYFQFQAPAEWVLLNNDLNNGKFVYVKKDKTLITHMLTIFVDRVDAFNNTDHRLTYVLPVDVVDGKRFNAVGEISKHCKESWPAGLKKDPAIIEHEEVKFECVPDSDQYNIIIGKRGGDANLDFFVKDDTTGVTRQMIVNMVYSDLTANPTTGDLPEIISSFVAT